MITVKQLHPPPRACTTFLLLQLFCKNPLRRACRLRAAHRPAGTCRPSGHIVDNKFCRYNGVLSPADQSRPSKVELGKKCPGLALKSPARSTVEAGLAAR